MLRSLASPFLYILLFSHASYGLSIATRAIQVAGPLISSPTEGTTIVAGQPFDFQYVVSDACHEGYSPFNVSLLSSQPTGLTSIGTLVDGDDDLLYTFGSFLSPNYGLPPLQGGSPPPPSTLTAPILTGVDGDQLYLTIIETIFGCPPNGRTEYALSSTPVIYSSSD